MLDEGVTVPVAVALVVGVAADIHLLGVCSLEFLQENSPPAMSWETALFGGHGPFYPRSGARNNIITTVD